MKPLLVTSTLVIHSLLSVLGADLRAPILASQTLTAIMAPQSEVPQMTYHIRVTHVPANIPAYYVEAFLACGPSTSFLGFTADRSFFPPAAIIGPSLGLQESSLGASLRLQYLTETYIGAGNDSDFTPKVRNVPLAGVGSSTTNAFEDVKPARFSRQARPTSAPIAPQADEWSYWNPAFGGNLPPFESSFWFVNDFIVGFRFTAPDGPHYGWMHFHRDVADFRSFFQIVAYEWNPIPNAPIRAGQFPDGTLRTEVTPLGLRLSWPASLTNCVVEASDSLGANAQWQSVGAATGTELTLPLPTVSRFYRLQRP